jgi:hypothetical protein
MGGSGVTIKSVVGLITFAEVYAVELNHACLGVVAALLL